MNRGDNVYQPESFPPAPESDASDAPVQIPGLRDEDREEVRSPELTQRTRFLIHLHSCTRFLCMCPC